MNIREIQTNFFVVDRAGNFMLQSSEATFLNQSTDIVTINEHLVLAPGQSFSLPSVSFPSIDKTIFKVRFNSPAGGKLLVVSRSVVS